MPDLNPSADRMAASARRVSVAACAGTEQAGKELEADSRGRVAFRGLLTRAGRPRPAKVTPKLE